MRQKNLYRSQFDEDGSRSSILLELLCKAAAPIPIYEIPANDVESREAMERMTKLQSVCETRWAARTDVLHTFRCSFTTVVDALEDLTLA